MTSQALKYELREKRPTVEELVAKVRSSTSGLLASELVNFFSDEGFSPNLTRTALQQALDKGLLVLGPELRLMAF